MTAEGKDGTPVELFVPVGGFGSFDKVFTTPDKLFSKCDELYEKLMSKREGVYPEAGVKTCILSGELSGMLAHEAVGHTVEADLVLGGSVASHTLNKEVASELVTMVDFAHTCLGKPAPLPVYMDDEGVICRDQVLIKDGILTSYMIDRLGSRRMGMEHTASARRQSYAYEPTSRMTNTFIDNGPDKNEDIIASIENGIYAAAMGGGSVNPYTGAFNFAVREGYMIRNGKICEPIRGASLIGTGSEVLHKIDMVGQNLDTAQGMCGSSSGSVPTDVGQPLIRVSKITVGGR
jgi:TldD protein